MSAHVPINNIIPFSLVDGPGSRTSIFLQGCNLRCLYCHNPETQALCVGCGDCVATCPADALSLECGSVVWDPQACTKCDTCIKVCTHKSSPRIKYMTAEDVYNEIKGYFPFVRGISTSGGECMLYPKFLYELFSLVKAEGKGALIDSNGTIDFELHKELLDLSDGVMLDVKAWDDAYFVKLTGHDGKTVRKNLVYLAKQNKLEEVRVIVTEDYNDPEATVDGIADSLGEEILKNTRIRLMKFRPYGVVGPMEHAKSPSDERMAKIEEQAKKRGFGTVVVS